MSRPVSYGSKCRACGQELGAHRGRDETCPSGSGPERGWVEGSQFVASWKGSPQELLEVADRFLRRQATIGELRAAVKAARE